MKNLQSIDGRRQFCQPAVLALVIHAGVVAAAPQGDFFEPPADRRRVQAVRVEGRVSVDGVLDEEVWRRAPVAGGFVQVEPEQLAPATNPTEVQVAYDDDALYVAARLGQPGGFWGFNQRDLRRDFPNHESDSFGVMLDTFGDGRNAQSFQVNPYGAQRDMQVIDDSLFEDRWDTLWWSATRRDDTGWTVELKIPFSSLRAGPPGTTWGIQLFRRERGRNEDTAYAPFPRTVSAWRMAYAAVLDGLFLAHTLDTAWQLRPYLAARADRVGEGPIGLAPAAGGELTWTPRTDVVADLTLNTDFAETEVDRRVVNLSRFNVFFPERRQFFLESAGVFAAGWDGEVQPYFSRQIGLTRGVPQPISVGARGVWRTPQRALGLLVVNTLPTAAGPGELFGVARYSHNLGEQSRVGGMVVARHELSPHGALGGPTNVVPVVDGLYRTGPLTVNASAMTSFSTAGWRSDLAPLKVGAAATLDAEIQGNWGNVSAGAAYVDRDFEARTGFVSRPSALRSFADVFIDWRPPWLPGWLRSIQPNGFVESIWSDRGQFQELRSSVTPVRLLLQGGDELGVFVDKTVQQLSDTFSPVPGVAFPAGAYDDEGVGMYVLTQGSRKVSLFAEAVAGRYFSAGSLRTFSRLSIQLIPHVQLSATYSYNRFWGQGVSRGVAETHLWLLETRLAVSPRLQLIGSFQRDSAGNLAVSNARLAWEFLPLSFLFVVFTDTRSAFGGPGAVIPQQQLVAKLTYTFRP